MFLFIIVLVGIDLLTVRFIVRLTRQNRGSPISRSCDRRLEVLFLMALF